MDFYICQGYFMDISILEVYMNTIERILDLQKQKGITNKELEQDAKLANGSITNWKNHRYYPSVSAIVSLAQYFHVTTDYLLCLSDVPVSQEICNSITPEDQLLLDSYHAATPQGRFHIIQVCMNERDIAFTAKEETIIAG